MNVLLSYPRSGNSLTRIILEYITRYTVIDETPNSPNSVINQLEIEEKNAYNELNVNKIDDQIILIKTHLFNTESTIQRFKTNKLNLIIRHYDDVISSHATKESIYHQITENWINTQVKLYCDIIKFYHNYNPLYYFYYEDLIDIDLQIKIIQKLIEKNEFENIIYTQDTKGIVWECDFRGAHIAFRPEDFKDQKSWRTCLAKHRIFWLTLPRPKKGPDPFELLMKYIVETATENTQLKYEDTLEEEQYQTLKDFFESTIEQDDFDKLKDGYTVLDSKTNMIYFKRSTLDRYLKRSSHKAFSSVAEALRLLRCDKHDYHEGEKNVWYVAMPEFVSHQAIKQSTNTSKVVSEMDDEYHTKFRTPKA